MIRALFGASTTPQVLREGLDRSMAAHQDLAARIAGAATTSSPTGSDASGGGVGGSTSGDLATDMATLADVQLRYEAEARLLQLVYQGLRTSISNHG